jgi:uncharacterized protein (DUF924 family)
VSGAAAGQASLTADEGAIAMNTDDVDRVLRVWFGEVGREGWFRKDADLDQRIKAEFGTVHEALMQSAPDASLADARTALAAVIVLDQFSRNMFRDTPRAFASDAKALALADAAVTRGFDQAVDAAARMFFYLPFEHSENGAMQVRSIALFTALGDPDLLSYAVKHKEIIDRFGRYPHRNAILGRTSTPEELAFLATPGSSF